VISFAEACGHVGKIVPLESVSLPLERALDLVCSQDVIAVSDCPSQDGSLKDGLAVRSSDIADARPDKPVSLRIQGTVTAGEKRPDLQVSSGRAVRVMTGAPIPPGATAVLAAEFAECGQEEALALADAGPGRNILRKGSDVARGQVVVRAGELLTPTHLGLLAAAGCNRVSCYRRPVAAVVATGSELVLPGEAVEPGKVAASNLITVAAELRRLGIRPETILVSDHLDKLQARLATLLDGLDVLITCGGVLDGDKDLTLQAMDLLGMERIVHRVRMGPGKGICIGRIGKTLVFNLPGGPPSNHVALVTLALPGIRRLMGFAHPFPPRVPVQAGRTVRGQSDWTQFVYCLLVRKGKTLTAMPPDNMSRLETMAASCLLLEIPQGHTRINQGESAEGWLFRPVPPGIPDRPPLPQTSP